MKSEKKRKVCSNYFQKLFSKKRKKRKMSKSNSDKKKLSEKDRKTEKNRKVFFGFVCKNGKKNETDLSRKMKKNFKKKKLSKIFKKRGFFLFQGVNLTSCLIYISESHM